MAQLLSKKPAEQENGEQLVSYWKRIHQEEDAYLVARNRDHLMFPFECDTCIFRKLRKRDPIENMYQDVLLLAGIRRGNLDVFWSSASSTVNKNTEKL